jgi:phospholipase/carboxylesterase
MHTENIKTAGKPVAEAKKALIMIHGRGGSAEDILSIASHLQVEDYALLAPQASNHTWYPLSFLAPTQQNEPGLSSALDLIAEMEKELNKQGIGAENIYFLGFSQGACLTLEYVSRNAKRYGGVVAFTGGLIGDKVDHENYGGDFQGTPVFIGTSDPDPHVPVERVQATKEVLQKMNAALTVKIYPNMGHTISQEEVDKANGLIFKQ